MFGLDGGGAGEAGRAAAKTVKRKKPAPAEPTEPPRLTLARFDALAHEVAPDRWQIISGAEHKPGACIRIQKAITDAVNRAGVTEEDVETLVEWWTATKNTSVALDSRVLLTWSWVADIRHAKAWRDDGKPTSRFPGSRAPEPRAEVGTRRTEDPEEAAKWAHLAGGRRGT